MRKGGKFLLVLSSLVLFSSCDASSITEDISSEAFLSKLIPNWPTFVAQIGALILLIVLFIVIAYKPLKKMLKKRGDYIENNIKEAEKNNELARKREEESQQALQDSQKEAVEIISQAKKDALLERQKLEEETAKRISEMKLSAESDIAKAKEDAVSEIEKEIIDVAMLTSEQLLEREINKEDNEKLAKAFIKGLKKDDERD